VANLSKTLHANFYQNRSTFAEVMYKSIFVCFYASQSTNNCIQANCGYYAAVMIA